MTVLAASYALRFASKDRQEPERKALNMVEKNLSYQSEQQRFTYFQALPKQSAYQQQRIDVKTLQHVEPYFEYPMPVQDAEKRLISVF